MKPNYSSLMTGGVCQCGGKLTYSKWLTKEETKERLYCKSCGRSEFISQSNSKKQATLF